MLDFASAIDVICPSTDREATAARVRASTRPYLILAEPEIELDRQSTAQLAAMVQRDGAAAGIGAISLKSGIALPPAIEELRFQDVAAHAAIIYARPALEAALERLPPMSDDLWKWHIARDVCWSGLVVQTHLVLGYESGQTSATDRGDRVLPSDRACWPPQKGNDLRTVLIYGPPDQSVSQYFDGLPPEERSHLRFLVPADPVSDLPHLIAAGLIVIVRGFEYLAKCGTLDLLDAMQVPYAWFIDDNLTVMSGEEPSFAYYDDATVRRFVARTTAVLASTPALAEALRPLGANTLAWPCIFDETLARPITDAMRTDRLRLAVIGGPFRRASLIGDVWPAVQSLNGAGGMTLYGRPDTLSGLDASCIRRLPIEESFRQFVFRWRGAGCATVLHPAGRTLNLPFKSPATMLASCYLGAVPIVANEPAYSDLSENEGVLVADSGVDSWRRAITRAMRDDERRSLLEALDRWCRRKFSAADGAKRFAVLLDLSILTDGAERERRLRRALAMPGFTDLWRNRQLEKAWQMPPRLPWHRRFARSALRRIRGKKKIG